MTRLDSGEVRVVPGFTGRVCHTFEPDATARPLKQAYRDMVAALPEGIAAGDYTAVGRGQPAWRSPRRPRGLGRPRHHRGGRAIADKLEVGQVAGSTRPGGRRHVQVADGPRISRPRNAFRARAVGSGRSGLDDDRRPRSRRPAGVLRSHRADPAQNVVPLYRRNELNQQQVLAVNEVAGVLDTAALNRCASRSRGAPIRDRRRGLARRKPARATDANESALGLVRVRPEQHRAGERFR